MAAVKNLSVATMALVVGTFIARPAATQISGQSFQVIPEITRATVGDSVGIRFRVRLDERDLLFDTVPQPIGALPSGVRVLSVDKLVRAPDRIFHGRARLAFYRPGRQAIPIFGLPFMRAVKGVQRATLASDSGFIDIVALLPAGNPPLKDIRELVPSAKPDLLVLAAAAVLAVALVVAYSRRRRRASAPVLAPERPAEPVPVSSPYSRALEALHRIQGEAWPSKGRVARHYESVVDVLRGYLQEAEDVPARERTTGELLWSLPPHLSPAGLRDRFSDLLDQADLVKFARLRPSAEIAELFLQHCRALLSEWHEARPASELTDALR